MKAHFAAALALAALALGAPLFAGPFSRPALVGAAMATATALASLYGFRRFGRSARRPVQSALVVFLVMFLVRILLVGIGVALFARAPSSAIAFVIAFFVPYFAFTAIEGSFVNSLNRGMRKPA